MIYPTLLISMPGGAEWLLIVFALPIYFVPTIIAASRRHPLAIGVFLLNFFLGWTILGWIGAFIWSLIGSSRQSHTVIVNNTNQAISKDYTGESSNLKPPVPPTFVPSKTMSQQEKVEHLRQLKQLLDEGILTQEEFNKQKAEILG